MKEELQIGDLVKHKVTSQIMIVVSNATGIKCRYQNPVTGLYEVQEFSKSELTYAGVK